jgi:copper(I)-binding protein
LEQSAAAFQDVFNPLASAAAQIVELAHGGAGVNEMQQVTLGPQPYGGTFTLSVVISATTYVTAPIAWNAAASTIQAALTAACIAAASGTGTFVVIQNTTNISQWVVQFTGGFAATAYAVMTANVSGLSVPIGLQGSLEFDTDGTEVLLVQLASNGSAQAQIQINWTPSGGKPITLYRAACTIEDSLISGSDIAPTPTPTPYYSRGVLPITDTTDNVLIFFFPSVLPSAPISINVWVMAPTTAGNAILATPVLATFTALGFSVILTGPVGASGYKLGYEAFLN